MSEKLTPQPAPPNLKGPAPNAKVTANNLDALGLDIYTLGEDTELGRNFTTIIYGNPDTGKTTLAATAAKVPKLCPVLLIDIDKGTLSIQRDYPDLPVVSAGSIQAVLDVFKKIKANPGTVKTVIVDSITELQQIGVQHVVNKRVKEGKLEDEHERDWVVWGANNANTKRIVRAGKVAEINVIFTAWEKVDKNEKTGREIIVPDMVGQTAFHGPGSIDYTWRLAIDKKGNRQLRTQSNKRILAKSRLSENGKSVLPELIEEPTFTQIMELMK